MGSVIYRVFATDDDGSLPSITSSRASGQRLRPL